MDYKFDLIRKQIDELELEVNKTNTSQREEKKKGKKPRERNAYQEHMSKRLTEMKTEAKEKGIDYNRKHAFKKAAEEWTINKNNHKNNNDAELSFW